MKTIQLIAALIIATPFAPRAESAYIADVIFPSGVELSLNVDAEGHAKKDYDAFISFPSTFETANSDLPRPTEWDKRGIGTFAEFTITQQVNQLVATLSLEDAELGEWTENKVKDATIRLPSFRSVNVSSTNLSFVPGQWIHLGGYSQDGSTVDGIKIRIRKNSSQQSVPAYGAQGAPSAEP